MSGKAAKSARHKDAAKGREHRDFEKRALIGEMALLTDQMDALKLEVETRKEKLLLLMGQDGDRNIEAEGIGTAGFTRRRSFAIKNAKLIAKMFSKRVLAENINMTAALYDAAVREGYRITEAVTQGEDENLTVARARDKESKKYRDAHIAEARKKAEQAIAAFRKQLKQF